MKTNEKIIYTVRLTRYLLSLGFEFKRTVPDPFKKGFLNWVFEDTPELNAAIDAFLRNQGE